MRACAIGEELVVPKDAAGNACGAGRAFYMDVADDRSKGAMTIDKERLERIKTEKRLIEERDAKKAAATASADQAGTHVDLIATAIARALTQALAGNR